MARPRWNGVFPAVTTQFNADESLNIPATQKLMERLIQAGVHGFIMLGTVGENCSLRPEEKRKVLAAAKEVVNGRIPILSGVAEFTTAEAAQYAKDAAKIGIDGLMVLPGMVYTSDTRETLNHFRTVARANRYLAERFLPAYNTEFGRPPTDPATAFVPLGEVDLDPILCHEEERVVGKDNTVQLDGVRLQLDKQPGRVTCAGLTVTIRRHLDGTHSVTWGKRRLGRYDAHGRRLEAAAPPPSTTEAAA